MSVENIVRVTTEKKRFEVYNNITESWHPLDSGKGSIYKTKNAARKVIDGLCAKYQQTCFFLVPAKKC
nr:hypothetical protein DGKKSRWO_DGKKSRWO_CDS_0085 [uncultured phage]CAI9752262.1 hypothetical protein CVNMHQAP_CVNMHQAP_CDS_0085 [uncultured phage]